jgi:hypothetical protein
MASSGHARRAAFFLLLACGQTSAQAPGLNQKYPPHPDVAALQQQISVLATTEKAKAQLRSAHKSWLDARALQCMGAAQKSSSETSQQQCFTVQDHERIAALKRLKLSLLLDQAASPKSSPPRGFVAALQSDGGVTGVAANDAAAIVVAAYYQKLAVIDTQTARTVHVIPLGKRYDRSFLSIFPNGRVALQTHMGARAMRFLDLKDGQVLSETSNAMGPSLVLPGGRLVAYADGDKLRLYDPLRDRDVSAPFPHNGELISRLAASPDGKKIATLTTAGTLSVWNLAPAKDQTYMLTRSASISTDAHPGIASAMLFSKGGESLFTASNNLDVAVTRWSATDLRRAESFTVGQIRGETLVRLEGTDMLVASGRHPSLDSYVMFLDMEAKKVALQAAPKNYWPILATSSTAQYLYSTTVHEVRRVDVPPAAEFESMEAKLAQLRPKPPEPPQRQVEVPALKDFPHDAVIEGVFVYEGGGALQESVNTASGMRRAVSVDLHVGKTAQPLALVLGSYEPVIWNIKASSEARITHIFLTGYYDSVVRGAPNVQIHHLKAPFWYPGEDRMLRNLNEQVFIQTGKKVHAVQGAYKGIRYYFGKGAPEPDRLPAAASSAHPPSGMRNRCVDKEGKVILTDRRCSDLGYRHHSIEVDSSNLFTPSGGIRVSPDVADCQSDGAGGGICTLNGGDAVIIQGR